MLDFEFWYCSHIYYLFNFHSVFICLCFLCMHLCWVVQCVACFWHCLCLNWFFFFHLCFIKMIVFINLHELINPFSLSAARIWLAFFILFRWALCVYSFILLYILFFSCQFFIFYHYGHLFCVLYIIIPCIHGPHLLSELLQLTCR